MLSFSLTVRVQLSTVFYRLARQQGSRRLKTLNSSSVAVYNHCPTPSVMISAVHKCMFCVSCPLRPYVNELVQCVLAMSTLPTTAAGPADDDAGEPGE